MSGVLGTGLSFWQFIGSIFALAFSVIAIKIAVSFDVNKYLERKDKRLDRKIKNACPHMQMQLVKSEGKKAQYMFQSLFESPPGTHQWQCQRCGLIRNHDNDYEKRAEYYAANPDEYIEMNKRFEKLLKKNGAL